MTAPVQVPRQTTAISLVAKRPGFFAKNRALVLSASALILIILLVVVLPFLLPDPNTTDAGSRLLPPSFEHLMGTDKYGRDYLSRMMTAGRVSIGMTLLITLLAAVLGTLLGLVAGYFPRVGGVVMRILDAWMAFPAIVLAIVFAVIIGPGVLSELLAVTVIFTPFTARVIRSRTMSLAARPYVRAARVAGMSSWKTLLVHVLPNTLPLAMVQCVLLASGAMLIDGSLSFLGLGVSPPTPTWGNLVAESRVYLSMRPSLLIFPGLAIAIFVFLVNIAGGSLRAFVDPRMRFLQERARLRRAGRLAG